MGGEEVSRLVSLVLFISYSFYTHLVTAVGLVPHVEGLVVRLRLLVVGMMAIGGFLPKVVVLLLLRLAHCIGVLRLIQRRRWD